MPAATFPGENGSRDEERALSKDSSDTEDPDVVGWDEQDPDRPQNWPWWKIYLNFVLVAALTFISPLGSAIFAPAIPVIVEEFQINSAVLEALVLSIYLVGYAAGPLVSAPLSEIYGRLRVYHASNICYIIFSVACAVSPNFAALIVFRFFAGVFGSTPITNGGGSVGDLTPPEKRGRAMSIYLLGPLLGPVTGPIAGGFLTEAAGWRWCFWLMAIVSGTIEIAMILGMSETYPATILRRRVAKQRKRTGNKNLRSSFDTEPIPPAAVFKRALIRPLKLLFLSPILNLASIWVSLTYAYIYIMFTTITPVFETTYGFRTDLVGLAYIGIGIGALIGSGVYGATADNYIQKMSEKVDAAADAEGRPKEGLKAEHRLFLLPLGVFMVPAGIFLYGWSANYHVHWMVPIIGTGILGCALNILTLSVMTYLVDAFKEYAASALAASTVVRCLLGGLLPMAGLPLYNKLGLGWGNSLLAFIAVALAPTSFLVLRYGEYLRKRYELKNL